MIGTDKLKVNHISAIRGTTLLKNQYPKQAKSIAYAPQPAPNCRRSVKTDGWAAYPGAPNVAHDPHVVGNMAAHIVLPWIHRVFSNLKTWALGVYHGLRRKHLQSYLDEFVFRFNRRRTRNAAFRSLLSIGLITKPITYEMLIRPEFAA